MNLWDILLSIFWFMILFAWIWLLISIVGDIFAITNYRVGARRSGRCS